MDTLTHTVLGACLGEAIAGKKLGKKAMLIGALVNNFPDIDVVAQLFTSPAQGLLVHRGITHSIFLNLLVSVLLALLFHRLFKKEGLSLKRSALLVSSGLFLHIFLDALTSYGTGWFEPFDHSRVSLNTLFILDPLFMLPLLIGAIALLILRRDSTKRFSWARTCLSISLVYLVLTFFIKAIVTNGVQKDLSARNIPHSDFMTTPGPLSNLLWYTVVKNDKEYYVGYRSLFDSSPVLDYEVISQNDSLLLPYRNSQEVQRMLRFSKGYYQVIREDSGLFFSDLRFGQAGGWCGKEAPFVFTYTIKGPHHAASLQRGRFKSFKPGVIKGLFARTMGQKDCGK